MVNFYCKRFKCYWFFGLKQCVNLSWRIKALNFLNKTKALPHAASKIVELINQCPNEVTIIALASLTTIALAYQMCPDFTKNIKNLLSWMRNFCN